MPKKSKDMDWRRLELSSQLDRDWGRLELSSQLESVEEHGEKLVRKAFNWIAKGIKAGDPSRLALYQRVMASAHPYELLVAHYRISRLAKVARKTRTTAVLPFKKRLRSNGNA